MLTVRCKDLGFVCDFEAKAPTVAELLAIVTEHERDVHGTRFLTQEEKLRIGRMARDNGERWEFE
jgi:predicted small metal-binding protein